MKTQFNLLSFQRDFKTSKLFQNFPSKMEETPIFSTKTNLFIYLFFEVHVASGNGKS